MVVLLSFKARLMYNFCFGNMKNILTRPDQANSMYVPTSIFVLVRSALLEMSCRKSVVMTQNLLARPMSWPFRRMLSHKLVIPDINTDIDVVSLGFNTV
jgi:hypothetical protein